MPYMMRLSGTSEIQIISAERVQRERVHRFRDRVKFIPWWCSWGENGDYGSQWLFIMFICCITVMGTNNPIIWPRIWEILLNMVPKTYAFCFRRGMRYAVQFPAHRLGGRLELCIIRGYALSEVCVKRGSTVLENARYSYLLFAICSVTWERLDFTRFH